jgi:hypothetical protein
MKKSIYRIVLFTLIAFSLVYACAPKVEVETAPTSLASTVLSIEYSDAANLRSQLAYGTIKLADTPYDPSLAGSHQLEWRHDHCH